MAVPTTPIFRASNIIHTAINPAPARLTIPIDPHPKVVAAIMRKFGFSELMSNYQVWWSNNCSTKPPEKMMIGCWNT